MTPLTGDERAFLKGLLERLTIAPSSPDAAATVQMVHNVLKKLGEA